MINAFIASYGYLALFLGTLLEGEAILLAAGFAASQGLLDWRLVIVVALAGATLGDQIAFLLGRWKAAVLIAHFPSLAALVPRVRASLERHHEAFILVNRFLYGLRIAGPVILGTTGMPYWRYALFDGMGAALWAVAITGAGYFFGVAMQTLFTHIKHISEAILVGILVAGFVLRLWRHRRKGRARAAR
ncbi:MAG: DedA family protein [Thiobacillaceae bacterium]